MIYAVKCDDCGKVESRDDYKHGGWNSSLRYPLVWFVTNPAADVFYYKDRGFEICQDCGLERLRNYGVGSPAAGGDG